MDKQDAEKDSTSAETVTPAAATCASTTTASSEAAPAPAEPAATTSAAPKIEPASIDRSQTVPSEASQEPAALTAATEAYASKTLVETVMSPGNRITLLAASLVLAAALGATAGALAGYHLALSTPVAAAAPATTSLAEIQALKENVVQARVELAALKVSVDVGNRNAGTQFTRMGERIDRLARDIAPKEATGSVAQPNGPPAAENATAMDRWVVRDVRRGAALLEGRMGLIEVVRGDMVPGLGRVAAIGKHDGRWIVITTKGLITSTR
jgi:hypothetical protein